MYSRLELGCWLEYIHLRVVTIGGGASRYRHCWGLALTSIFGCHLVHSTPRVGYRCGILESCYKRSTSPRRPSCWWVKGLYNLCFGLFLCLTCLVLCSSYSRVVYRIESEPIKHRQCLGSMVRKDVCRLLAGASRLRRHAKLAVRMKHGGELGSNFRQLCVFPGCDVCHQTVRQLYSCLELNSLPAWTVPSSRGVGASNQGPSVSTICNDFNTHTYTYVLGKNHFVMLIQWQGDVGTYFPANPPVEVPRAHGHSRAPRGEHPACTSISLFELDPAQLL